MISQLFSAPFQKYKQDRVQLQEIEQESPKRNNITIRQNISQAQKSRIKKLRSLPCQIQKLIQDLIVKKYKEELKSILDAQFLKVKNTNHTFFGETSILETSQSMFRHKPKVAQGLCEIFFENYSYLIGYFKNGQLKGEFIHILNNGNYMKAQNKRKTVKRQVSGFRTDDTQSLQSSDQSQSDDDRIDQSEIQVRLNDEKSTDKISNLQTEILYNGIYYQGPLQNGKLNGNAIERAKDYQFKGRFYMGERMQGKLISTVCFGPSFEYQGTFKNNKFDGLGTLKTVEGTYSGQFKNGFKDGQGQFKWKDGSTYQGDFKRDLRDGKGFFKSRQGSFKGEWRKDCIQGTGYLVVGSKGVGGQWLNSSYQKPHTFF